MIVDKDEPTAEPQMGRCTHFAAFHQDAKGRHRQCSFSAGMVANREGTKAADVSSS